MTKSQLMTKAHQMTKEIKAKHPEVNYKFQLGLCLSFLHKEGKKKEVSPLTTIMVNFGKISKEYASNPSKDNQAKFLEARKLVKANLKNITGLDVARYMFAKGDLITISKCPVKATETKECILYTMEGAFYKGKKVEFSNPEVSFRNKKFILPMDEILRTIKGKEKNQLVLNLNIKEIAS